MLVPQIQVQSEGPGVLMFKCFTGATGKHPMSLHAQDATSHLPQLLAFHTLSKTRGKLAEDYVLSNVSQESWGVVSLLLTIVRCF